MTEYSRQTIINALKIIKGTCDKAGLCSDCPLSRKSDYKCLIKESPQLWKIIDSPPEKKWKAFK